MRFNLLIILWSGILTHFYVNCFQIPEDVEIIDDSLIQQGLLIDVMPEDSSGSMFPISGQSMESRFRRNVPITGINQAKAALVKRNGSSKHQKRSSSFIEFPKIHLDPTNAKGEVFPWSTLVKGLKRNRRETLSPEGPQSKSEKRSISHFYSVAAQPAMSDKWTKVPLEYTKGRSNQDGDSIADSSINDGIKARTPRVSFVTQQRGSVNGDQKTSATKSDDSNTRPIEVYNKGTIEKLYDVRERDLYEPLPYRRSNYYDRYESRVMEPYEYERDYYYRDLGSNYVDSYMPQVPLIHYHNYPDSRYDVPEPRDYRPPLTNEIDRFPLTGPPPLPTDYFPNRNRRIIYYAHLPEVVRTPPGSFGFDRPYDPYYSGALRNAPFLPLNEPPVPYRNSRDMQFNKNSKPREELERLHEYRADRNYYNKDSATTVSGSIQVQDKKAPVQDSYQASGLSVRRIEAERNNWQNRDKMT